MVDVFGFESTGGIIRCSVLQSFRDAYTQCVWKVPYNNLKRLHVDFIGSRDVNSEILHSGFVRSFGRKYHRTVFHFML